MIPTYLVVAVIFGAIVLLLPLVVRPTVAVGVSGRIIAFLSLAVVPVLAGMLGLADHVERAKTTAFCLSCHPMEKYGKSLYVDSIDFMPAAHYQFGRVAHDSACFTCHTTYTMFGDYKAKLAGLHHVYVQYLGKVPDPIKLYEPYNNRECLHCHNDSRSFLEGVSHKSEPGRMQSIRDNQLSCLAKGCHDTAHAVDQLGKVTFWTPGGGAK